MTSKLRPLWASKLYSPMSLFANQYLLHAWNVYHTLFGQIRNFIFHGRFCTLKLLCCGKFYHTYILAFSYYQFAAQNDRNATAREKNCVVTSYQSVTYEKHTKRSNHRICRLNFPHTHGRRLLSLFAGLTVNFILKTFLMIIFTIYEYLTVFCWFWSMKYTLCSRLFFMVNCLP